MICLFGFIQPYVNNDIFFREHFKHSLQILVQLKLGASFSTMVILYSSITVCSIVLQCWNLEEMMSLQRCQWFRNLSSRVDLVAQPLLFLQALLITSHLQGHNECSRAV